MRKLMLALGATAMVVPMVAVPTTAAMAREYKTWRGKDGRTYCKKDNGTTGLLIGGAVGGLAGHEIAGRGDKTLGTVVGAGAGALLGRHIDKKEKPRCR